MKNNQQPKLLSKRMLSVSLLSAIVTLFGGLAFAGNNTLQLVENEVSTESTVKVDRLHDSFERKQSTESLSWTLTAAQWEISRNGESVLSLAVLNDLVRTWSASVQNLQNISSPLNNEIIEIKYPGGEEGEVWVEELVDWLVALGVPSSYLSVTQNSAADDEIIFQLYKND